MQHEDVCEFIVKHMKEHHYKPILKTDEDYLRSCRIINADDSAYLKFVIELHDVEESIKRYTELANLMKQSFAIETYTEYLKDSLLSAIMQDNFYMSVPSREIILNIIRFDSTIVQFICFEKNNQIHVTKILYDEYHHKITIKNLC